MPVLIKHEKDKSCDKKHVLAKALSRMAVQLDLSLQELSAIIGPSESTLRRLFCTPNRTLDPKSKEGQLALLLLRLYRSLNILFGGNTEQCQLWLRSNNTYLNAVPINLIQSIEGLIFTIQYLDAMKKESTLG